VVAEIDRIERTLSHWVPDSATSFFNASRAVDYQKVPKELGALVAFTRDLSRATSGAYDVTVGPLVGLWGFGPRRVSGQVPTTSEIQEVLSRIGWDRLSVAGDLSALRKAHPMLELDLGSVLQGYAVDRVCDLLSEAGVPEYLVEVGGELRARGAWKVAIENPVRPEAFLTTLTLEDSALATSGIGRGGRHILSTHTGRPVESGLVQISVNARTCLEADGWATALFASGWDRAQEISMERGLSLWALKKDLSLARFHNTPHAPVRVAPR
jgi:thiamine biosynthesis lipoprotein